MQIYNSTRTQTGMKQNGKSTEFESCNFDDGNDDLSNWRFPQLQYAHFKLADISAGI